MGKKKTEEKVEETQPEMLVESPEAQPAKGDAQLRDANSGVFYRGPKPAGTPTGTNAGEPYWVV